MCSSAYLALHRVNDRTVHCNTFLWFSQHYYCVMNKCLPYVCMYAYIQHVAVDMQSIMVKSHWLVNCSVNIFLL